MMFTKYSVLQGTFSNHMIMIDRIYFPRRSLEDLANIKIIALFPNISSQLQRYEEHLWVTPKGRTSQFQVVVEIKPQIAIESYILLHKINNLKK